MRNQLERVHSRTEGQRFLLLVAASLLLRLVVLWFVGPAHLASDSTDYREMASQLLSGAKFVPYWPPGMPLYLAPFVAAGAGNVMLRLATLPWWIFFCFGFARLARDLSAPYRLWMAALAVFSVTPALVHFSIEPMTQMPAAALLLWGLSAAVRCAMGAGWGEALLMGTSLGYLALVRPSAMPLMVLIPAVVWFCRRSLVLPLVAVGLSAVMLLAWMAHVDQLSGRWRINNSNGVNAYYGNNPWTPLYRTWYFGSHAKLGTDEIHQFPEYERIVAQVTTLPLNDRSAAFQDLAKKYVLSHPGAFLLRSFNRVRCFWGFDTFTAANLRESHAGRRWFPVALLLDAVGYLLIAGCAVFWIAAAPGSLWREWQTWLLAGSIVIYSLPYWVTMSHPTYHFPVLAPLILLGMMARNQGLVARGRGWAALVVLGLIQVEWLFFLTKN